MKAHMKKEQVSETFKAGIRSIINGNKAHGWGQADSMAVIEDLLAEWADAFVRLPVLPPDATKEAVEARKVEMADQAEVRDAVLAGINQVVNPSAFRQWLESPKVGFLTAKESKGARTGRLVADFTE